MTIGPETDMTIHELHSQIERFGHAQDLVDDAECGEWPESDDPGRCYNCGAYAKTYDGHTYICPVCGDEWDTWLDPLEEY